MPLDEITDPTSSGFLTKLDYSDLTTGLKPEFFDVHDVPGDCKAIILLLDSTEDTVGLI